MWYDKKYIFFFSPSPWHTDPETFGTSRVIKSAFSMLLGWLVAGALQMASGWGLSPEGPRHHWGLELSISIPTPQISANEWLVTELMVNDLSLGDDTSIKTPELYRVWTAFKLLNTSRCWQGGVKRNHRPIMVTLRPNQQTYLNA